MGKHAPGWSLLVVFLASAILAPSIFPANAIDAKGVLKQGEDHVHFDLTLTANMTATAFNITKKWFEEDREGLRQKWTNWKTQWEEDHKDWRGNWSEYMKKWMEWAERDHQFETEWEHKWQQQWAEPWDEKWANKWDKWEEWMNKWNEKWEQLKIEETEKMPEFIGPGFQEKMKEKFDELWNKHMNAPTMARCWGTPASQFGLKNALANSINKTLQWIYNSSDVYIKNFNLSIEVTTKTSYTDGTYMMTGVYAVAQSFDLYGVVTSNSSGTFIRSQFRSFNVTEKVDGAKFGFPGWVFTPSKAMFLDLSVFSFPLEQWENTYDSDSNTTTFTLVRDINVTTPYGNVIIDPEMVLVVPGRATAAGNTITIASILPADLVPIEFVVAATIIATVVLAGYYAAMRRRTAAVPSLRPA